MSHDGDVTRRATRPAYTLVSFHAHPDDEALLTAGSLAKAAAAGHRVVLVVATAGEAGDAPAAVLAGGPLAERRLAELHRSAEVLGCARVVCLGYADSGLAGILGGRRSFATADVEPAARRLADLLVEERAHVLTVYDAAGGYGHPDHVQVHRVGVRAAQLAGTPVVLEATVDRDLLRRAVRVLRHLPGVARSMALPGLDDAYTPRRALTHRIDVRPYARQKRAALAAHASQATADHGTRTLGILLRLPTPIFRLALGHEWYVEHGRRARRRLRTDLFSGLEPPTRARASPRP